MINGYGIIFLKLSCVFALFRPFYTVLYLFEHSIRYISDMHNLQAMKSFDIRYVVWYGRMVCSVISRYENTRQALRMVTASGIYTRGQAPNFSFEVFHDGQKYNCVYGCVE